MEDIIANVIGSAALMLIAISVILSFIQILSDDAERRPGWLAGRLGVSMSRRRQNRVRRWGEAHPRLYGAILAILVGLLSSAVLWILGVPGWVLLLIVLVDVVALFFAVWQDARRGHQDS